MLSFTLACLPLLFLVFCSRTMGRASAFALAYLALAYLDLAVLLEAAGLETTTSLVISLAVLLPAISRGVRSRCRMLLVPLLVLLPALSAWRFGAFCLLLSAAVLPSFFIPAWRRVCLLAIPSLLLPARHPISPSGPPLQVDVPSSCGRDAGHGTGLHGDGTSAAADKAVKGRRKGIGYVLVWTKGLCLTDRLL